MKITDLVKTKKGRYSVFVNGEFVFSVSVDQILMDRIFIGKEVTPDDLKEMLATSQKMYAKQKAVNLLSARSYTRKGLGDKLAAYADEDVVEEILDYFEKMGYIDDRDYAVRKANDLYKIKKYGVNRVKMTLIQKGIDKSLAEEIAKEQEPDSVNDDLYSVLTKKYSKAIDSIGDRQEFYKQKSKIMSGLVRMGYDFDDINSALQRYLEENELYF